MTGVQTCALPISGADRVAGAGGERRERADRQPIRAGRESVQQGTSAHNVGGMHAAGMTERRILRYGV